MNMVATDVNIHQAIFTLSQAAEATGVSPNTVRTWFTRGHMALGKKDKTAARDGLARIVTGRTVLQIGIAAALVRMGMSPARAFRAAAAFSVVGDRDYSCGGEQRLPGQLWPGECYSWLMVKGGEGAKSDWTADVIRHFPGKNDVLTLHQFHRTGGLMLPLNHLVNGIRAKLGLVPDKGTID